MSRFSQGGSEGDISNPSQINNGDKISGLSDDSVNISSSDAVIYAGELDLSSQQTTPDQSSQVIRIVQIINSSSQYIAARALVSKANETKVLSIVYDSATTDGFVQSSPINIPLVGQTIKSIVDDLNKVSGIVAEVLNGSENISSSVILESSSFNITNMWGYLYASSDQMPGNSELASGLKFFYTSVEPEIEQLIPSQSVGGFVSPTQSYLTETLLQSISFYDKILQLSGESLSSYQYLMLGDEIVEILEWNGSTAKIKSRSSFGSPIRFHAVGTIVRGFTKNSLFTNIFSDDRHQYRCLALKNTTASIAKDVRIFFKIKSRNSLSNFKLAIEIPKSEYHEGISSDGTVNSLIDNSLVGQYIDDYYKGCSITFTSGNVEGQTRIISKYISSSGKIELDSSLFEEINTGSAFYINTAPSQRLKSGTREISLSSGENPPYLISEVKDATFFTNGVDININNSRSHGNNLYPNEVIYVWIRREIDELSDNYNNNRLVLSASYREV